MIENDLKTQTIQYVDSLPALEQLSIIKVYMFKDEDLCRVFDHVNRQRVT